ncbi:MAG: AbrB/MazE/SpoVT family DNA-binding domain-containing protein [Armatimonadetes bacterium]|nr:AbrB/MazE/SpoVT family DNA-binding domain-containing protein [Armatimonadota bacterium]
MPTATVTSKGQITLPKQVRAHLRLKAGDRVDFLIENDGRVLLQPVTIDVSELSGILYRKGMRAATVDEMHEAIGRHVAEAFRRSTRRR